MDLDNNYIVVYISGHEGLDKLRRKKEFREISIGWRLKDWQHFHERSLIFRLRKEENHRTRDFLIA